MSITAVLQKITYRYYITFFKLCQYICEHMFENICYTKDKLLYMLHNAIKRIAKQGEDIFLTPKIIIELLLHSRNRLLDLSHFFLCLGKLSLFIFDLCGGSLCQKALIVQLVA